MVIFLLLLFFSYRQEVPVSVFMSANLDIVDYVKIAIVNSTMNMIPRAAQLINRFLLF